MIDFKLNNNINFMVGPEKSGLVVNNVKVETQSQYLDIKNRIVGVYGYLSSDEGELRSINFLLAPILKKQPSVPELSATQIKLLSVPSSYIGQLASYDQFTYTLPRAFLNQGNVFVKSITGSYNAKNLKSLYVCFSNSKIEICEMFGAYGEEEEGITTKTVYMESAVNSVELLFINTQMKPDGPVNAGFALVNFGVNRSSNFRVGMADSEVPLEKAKRDKLTSQINETQRIIGVTGYKEKQQGGLRAINFIVADIM